MLPATIPSLERLRTLVSVKENTTTYDLDAKYKKFNLELFDNALPQIPVTWAKLSKLAGIATVKLRKIAPSPDRQLVRMGQISKYANKRIRPETLQIKISSVYRKDERHLDGILLHEMIHVEFLASGDIDECHGPAFIKRASEISAKIGHTVPLTDNIDNLELASNKLKSIIVIHYRNDNKDYCGLLKPTSFAADETLIGELQSQVDSGDRSPVTIYQIASPIWTKLATRRPVQRKFTKAYGIDAEAFSDLVTNGRVITEIKPQPK